MFDRGPIVRAIGLGTAGMAVVAGLAFGAAGSGSIGSAEISLAQSDEGGSAAAQDERRQRAEEWRECVESQGVDLPDVERDEDGRPVGGKPDLTDEQREAIRAAAGECGPPPGHRARAARRQAVSEWRECVESQGVDLPDERPDELTDEQREAIRATAEECGPPPHHCHRASGRDDSAEA